MYKMSMENYTRPMQLSNSDDKEHMEKLRSSAWDSQKDALAYYLSYKIYFDPELCKLVDQFQKTLQDVFIDISLVEPWDRNSKHYPEDYKHKTWSDAWNVMRKDMPHLFEKLEKEFRIILGVKKEMTSDHDNGQLLSGKVGRQKRVPEKSRFL